jgi:hypothetical protein
MKIFLLFCFVILISSKRFPEFNKPEEKIQNEDLDDLELLLSRTPARRSTPSRQNSRPVYRQTPVYKPSTSTYKPTTSVSRKNIQISRPNIPTSRTNIVSSKPNNPSSRPNTPIYGPFNPQSSKPNLNNPIISRQTTSSVKSTSTPSNNASQKGTTSLINKVFNKLDQMPNNIPVVNPLNNRKNFNAGNKLKIGVENDFHNIKADGTYTNSRTLPSGQKIDTKYSGSIGAKFEDGKKGINGSIGKTSTTYRGANYSQKGNEHSFSVDANHKDGNKGIEASYANTRTNGNRKKLERKLTGGVIDKKGGIYGNFGYQNKIQIIILNYLAMEIIKLQKVIITKECNKFQVV